MSEKSVPSGVEYPFSIFLLTGLVAIFWLMIQVVRMFLGLPYDVEMVRGLAVIVGVGSGLGLVLGAVLRGM